MFLITFTILTFIAITTENFFMLSIAVLVMIIFSLIHSRYRNWKNIAALILAFFLSFVAISVKQYRYISNFPVASI